MAFCARQARVRVRRSRQVQRVSAARCPKRRRTRSRHAAPKNWQADSRTRPPGTKVRMLRVRSISARPIGNGARSEEHTSELQSLMRISYAVFCLKKKKKITQQYQVQYIYNTKQVPYKQDYNRTKEHKYTI